MTHAANIREQLDRIATWDEFLAVGQSLSEWQASDLYAALFPLAISGREGHAPWYAGCLLIDLQPDCPERLSDILVRIHASAWFVSFREVPFYLISQFGKRPVLEAAAQFLQTLPPQCVEGSRVKALAYWVHRPASDLCKHFHDWETEKFLAAAAGDA